MSLHLPQTGQKIEACVSQGSVMAQETLKFASTGEFRADVLTTRSVNGRSATLFLSQRAAEGPLGDKVCDGGSESGGVMLSLTSMFIGI